MNARRPLSLLLPLLLAGCGAAASSDTGAVRKSGSARYLATSVGRVDSESEARQLVAAADGVIRRIHVARGERVAAGQLLLSVDCAPRDAMAQARDADAARLAASAGTVLAGARDQQRDSARQKVTGAQAVRDDAADRLAQAQALADKGFISRRELSARANAMTEAEAALAAARAEASLVHAGARPTERQEAVAARNAARAEARAAAALAGQCSLRSPVQGQVLQILRREGEFSGASQGTPLIVVGDLSRLIVRAEITERDAARVRPGQAADIWIEGASPRWHGQIETMAQVMGRRSARSLDPTDRFDRDVREAFIRLDGPLPPALVGLRVMVGVKP
jgi:HlyD family secretion protein